jgi:glycosyltransferase involved in cell wall biosynthesis
VVLVPWRQADQEDGRRVILTLSDLWVPFPGGAERLAFNVARDLYRRGESIAVVTGYGPAQEFDGPPVRVLPIPVGPNRDEGGRMVADLISMVKPSVILTHHYYASQFRPEIIASGIPFVQIVLNGHRIPEAALAIYISRWVRDQCGLAHPQDIVMTPPAFDDVVAETHGDYIGFIKPIPHKGVRLVYEIARAMPERQFLILRGEWQNLEVIEHLPNVEFMEPVDDIRDFYARCRMVLMPSLSEDAGTVAQECALNGIPCLSTNVGGLFETNAGGLTFGTHEPVASWVYWINKLDNQTSYDSVTTGQRAHLARLDHAGTLDLLASRIRLLMEARNG